MLLFGGVVPSHCCLGACCVVADACKWLDVHASSTTQHTPTQQMTSSIFMEFTVVSVWSAKVYGLT